MTPDSKMITRMLHLPTDENTLHNEQSAQSVNEHTAEYEVDNRTVYDILDQICNDTDLYQYVKQHKLKGDGRGAFLCHSFQMVRPKPCQCNSIRSQVGASDVDL